MYYKHYEFNEFSSLVTLYTGLTIAPLTGTFSPLIACPTTLVSSLTKLDFCKYIKCIHFVYLVSYDIQDVVFSHYLMFLPYFQMQMKTV